VSGLTAGIQAKIYKRGTLWDVDYEYPYIWRILMNLYPDIRQIGVLSMTGSGVTI